MYYNGVISDSETESGKVVLKISCEKTLTKMTRGPISEPSWGPVDYFCFPQITN
jgi:hypothetical protein